VSARLGAGLALLVLAVLAAAWAADVRAWPGAFADGDVRYRANPVAEDLWQPTQRVPFGVGRSLAGVGDDLELRHAVRLFRISRGAVLSEAREARQLLPARAEALRMLTEMENGRGDARRRSQAATMLALMDYEASVAGGVDSTVLLQRAVAELRNAIRLDPENELAKTDLEQILRFRSENPNITTRGRGNNGPTQVLGGGAGLARPGRGY
jgi:hypothetical protein